MQWQSKHNKRKEKATNAKKERKLGLATKEGKLRPKIKEMTMGVKNTFPKNVAHPCALFLQACVCVCTLSVGMYIENLYF